MVKEFNVRGMTCGHCQSSVQNALLNMDGVSSADVDLATGKVAVTFDETKVTSDDLKQAVEDQGYDVVA